MHWPTRTIWMLSRIDNKLDKAIGFKPGYSHEPVNQQLDLDTREYVFKG